MCVQPGIIRTLYKDYSCYVWNAFVFACYFILAHVISLFASEEMFIEHSNKTRWLHVTSCENVCNIHAVCVWYGNVDSYKPNRCNLSFCLFLAMSVGVLTVYGTHKRTEWFEWFLVLVFTFIFTFPCAFIATHRLRVTWAFAVNIQSVSRAYEWLSFHACFFLSFCFNWVLSSLALLLLFFVAAVCLLSYRNFPSCTMCLHHRLLNFV